MNTPTQYYDTPAAVARIPEVPAASFQNGVNAGGLNAPGIGIATDNPDLNGDPASWTLLDQYGDARTPQNSQAIGGSAYNPAANYPSSGGESGKPVNRAVLVSTPDVSGDGTVTVDGAAHLPDLATGWAAV